MRPLAAASVATVTTAAVLLSACSTGNDDVVVETVVVTQTQEPGATPPAAEDADPVAAEAAEAADPVAGFAAVLDSPPTMPEDRTSRFHPTGTHSYAIVEATGDDTPDMLLRIDGTEFSRVLLYTLDSAGQPVASRDYLIDGAAGAGGSRARVLASDSGAGVYEISYQSINREGTSRLFRLEGRSLVAAEEQTVEALSTPPDHVEITWLDVSDRGADAARGTRPSPALGAAPAASHGVSYTGTVVEKSTSEVMQGRPSPNGEPESNRYYLLELDAPTDATAKLSGGGWDTRTITAVSLGRKDKYDDDSAEWLPLVGKRVTVAPAKPQEYWPSDTGLPLGMLWVGRSYDVVEH